MSTSGHRARLDPLAAEGLRAEGALGPDALAGRLRPGALRQPERCLVGSPDPSREILPCWGWRGFVAVGRAVCYATCDVGWALGRGNTQAVAAARACVMRV